MPTRVGVLESCSVVVLRVGSNKQWYWILLTQQVFCCSVFWHLVTLVVLRESGGGRIKNIQKNGAERGGRLWIAIFHKIRSKSPPRAAGLSEDGGDSAFQESSVFHWPKLAVYQIVLHHRKSAFIGFAFCWRCWSKPSDKGVKYGFFFEKCIGREISHRAGRGKRRVVVVLQASYYIVFSAPAYHSRGEIFSVWCVCFQLSPGLFVNLLMNIIRSNSI